ncbi:MAG: molybdopterin molybdotransferase MoeA [Sulfolobales archaeon]
MKYSVAEASHDPFEAIELYLKELGSLELGCEVVPVEDAYGRVLCEDIRAPISLPPFPRSLVDGFAVIYDDIAGASKDNPSKLKLLGRISVGEDASNIEVPRGGCYAVDTGSYVPLNTDLIIPYERTSIAGDYVFIYNPLPRGSNIAYPGSDIHRGFIIAKRGWRADERIISAIASAGVKSVKVYRRVRICIAATGNELQEPGGGLEPGKIYESNLEALSALLRSEGFEVHSLGILRDRADEIKEAITKGLEICDLLFITGGTSAGIEDYVYRAIEEMGRVIIRGIKYKPGKPLTLGVIRGKPVIGLPGNPVSVIMLIKTIMSKLLSRVRGEEDWLQMPLNGRGKLLRSVRGAEGRLTHIPSILIRGEKGLFILPWVLESYMISRLALADIFIEIPYDTQKRILKPMEEVEFRSLSHKPRAWIIEAGEILWGTGIVGDRLRLYTSREEALSWLEVGAVARVYICERIDLSEGRAVVRVLPDNTLEKYRVEVHRRSKLYRIPGFPHGTCYSEAVKSLISREGVERYLEIPVEFPEQAFEMFIDGYLDLAFSAERIS